MQEVDNVFVKVNYFGFYPLGSDVCYNDVKIMQTPWEEYRFPVFVFGKKQTVDPCFGQVFYAKNDNQTVFFVAIEYGLGHYHIFSINDCTQQKMIRKINSN